jgi:tetratricopeptide (TPR) repeat protein
MVGWLIVVALAAVAAAASIANELSPLWAALVPAVAAGVGVVGPQALAATRERQRDRTEREARATERIQRIHALVLDWPLTFSAVAPEDLGVSPSARAREHDQQRYITRDVDDAELAPALASWPFVLVSGASKAGKSRTAFEVSQRLFANDLVVVPTHRPEDAPDALHELFDKLDILADAEGRRVVIWLDDIQRYVRFRAIDNSLLRRWRTHDPPIVVLATIRDAELVKMRDDERGILERATRIELPTTPSPEELARATSAFPGLDFSSGIGVQLVDIPQLIETLRTAAIGYPQAHALISAAVDWQRATSSESISKEDLWATARLPEYRRGSPGAVFRDQDLDEALGWCMTTLPSGISFLHATDDAQRFVAFDYLVDYAEGRVEQRQGERPVPSGLWDTALERLDADACALIGFSAQFLQEWDIARRAWTEARGSDDPGTKATAAIFMGVVELQLGAPDKARSLLEEGLAEEGADLDETTHVIGLTNLSAVDLTLGDVENAAAGVERAIEIGEAADADVLTLLAALIAKTTLLLARRDAGAVAVAERAAEIAEKELPEDHPVRAAALLGLAKALVTDEQLTRAEEAAKSAVDAYSSSTSPTTFLTAAALVALANVHRLNGAPDAAITDLTRAQGIQEAVLGTDHPALADTFLLLALTKRKLGDLEGAEADLERAFATRGQVYSADHLEFSQLFQLRGLIKQDAGDTQGGKADMQTALTIVRSRLGDEHIEVARALHRVGELNCELDEYELAKRDFERAVAIKQQRLDENHADLAASLSWLALACEALGEFGESRDALERFAAIQRVNDQSDVAYTLHRLGYAKWRLANYADAKRDLEEAAAIKSQALARDDDVRLDVTLELLGIVERELGEFDHAHADLGRALAIEEATNPQDDAAIARTLSLRASVSVKCEQPSAAETDLSRALYRLVSAFGDVDPRLADVLEQYAETLAELAGPRAAKESFEWALAASRAMDVNAAETAGVLASLASILEMPAVKSGPALQPQPADEPLAQILAIQRAQLFELRRRALTGEDMRAALSPCLARAIEQILLPYHTADGWDLPELGTAVAELLPDSSKFDAASQQGPRPMPDAVRAAMSEAWDAREAALGEELTRALERFLLLQVIDECWPSHRTGALSRAAAISPRDGPGLYREALEHELTVSFWKAFLKLLFHVQVNVENDGINRARAAVGTTTSSLPTRYTLAAAPSSHSQRMT